MSSPKTLKGFGANRGYMMSEYTLNVNGTYFSIERVHKYVLQIRNHSQHLR